MQFVVIIGGQEQGAGLVRGRQEGERLDARALGVNPLVEFEAPKANILQVEDLLAVLEDSDAAIKMPGDGRDLAPNTK